MIRGEDLPDLNAFLNALSALLLGTGFVCIRWRSVTSHIVCMLAALTVSTLFLGSYVYYHVVVKGGKHTEFSGEGWVRGVYYTVLWSHIFLAAVIVPLALYTAYLGLRRRWTRHIRLARWTFPAWLYVSVTGVVVYWLLYHLYPRPG
jgi:uncharacterized membrane protein YozB (DUF420 family)